MFIVSVVLFIAGGLNPDIVLLDAPFGFGHYVLDALGLWKSGPSWVAENRPLAILCFFVVPFVVSVLWTALIVWLSLRFVAVFGTSKDSKEFKEFEVTLLTVLMLALLLSIQTNHANRVIPNTNIILSHAAYCRSNW